MSEKYKMNDPEGIYFLTMTIVYWIDLFTRKELCHIVIEALAFAHKNKGLKIHAWCIMPSHVHLIVSTEAQPLSAIFRDLKRHTSKEIVKEIQQINESRKEWLLRAFHRAGKELKRITHYKVWQDGNHPISLETNHFLEQKLKYIHRNPVEAEIVYEPEAYRFSSAGDYAGVKGILPVSFLF